MTVHRSSNLNPVAADSSSYPSSYFSGLYNRRSSSDQTDDNQFEGSLISEVLKHNGSVNIQTGNTYMTDRNLADFIGSIPQNTDHPESQVSTQDLTAFENSQKRYHEELISEIAVLKSELQTIKRYLSTILQSQNTMTLALNKYNDIHK